MTKAAKKNAELIKKFFTWNTKWMWLWLSILYIVFTAVSFYPIFSEINTHYFGFECNDVFDEMWFGQTVLHGIVHGDFISSNTQNFPARATHFIHGAWLHVFLLSPISLSFPWPLWWNLCIIATLVTTSLALSHLVYKITSQKLIALCAGLGFISMHWTFTEVTVCHFPQLLLAPLFLACGYIDDVFRKAYDPKGTLWLKLTLCTVATGYIYWVNGIFLLIFGLTYALLRLPNWNKTVVRNVCLAAVTALIVLVPSMFFMFKNYDPVQLKKPREFTINIACDNSVNLFPMDNTAFHIKRVEKKSWGNYVPGLLFCAAAILAAVELKKQNSLCLWILITGIFFTLCLGPYLKYGLGIIGTDQGVPVKMPYLRLLETIPTLFGWRWPSRCFSVFYACFCTSLGLICASYAKMAYKKWGEKTGHFSSIAVSLFLAILLLLTAWNNNFSPLAKRDSLNKFSIPGLICNDTSIFMNIAFKPGYCNFLAEKPYGAVLDLPICYTNNTWILQPQHHMQVLQLRDMIVPDFVNMNKYLRDMIKWNEIAIKNSAGTVSQLDRPYLPQDVISYGVRGPHYGKANRLFSRQPPPFKEASSTKESLKQVYDKGLRYAVLHRANCYWMNQYYGGLIYKNFQKLARDHFGEPIYRDYQNEVFAIPKP